jgi:hypothetical protein
MRKPRIHLTPPTVTLRASDTRLGLPLLNYIVLTMSDGDELILTPGEWRALDRQARHLIKTTQQGKETPCTP